MWSERFMGAAKVSYFGAGAASVCANFLNIECGKPGAAMFVAGTIMLAPSAYKRLEERRERRIQSASRGCKHA